MLIPPRLTGSIVRSSWKTFQESDSLYLQQHATVKRRSGAATDTLYRIITRGFPHYKLAESTDLADILGEFGYLSNQVLAQIDGKKTSKKIIKWYRAWLQESHRDYSPNNGINGRSLLTEGEMLDSDTDNSSSGMLSDMEQQQRDNFVRDDEMEARSAPGTPFIHQVDSTGELPDAHVMDAHAMMPPDSIESKRKRSIQRMSLDDDRLAQAARDMLNTTHAMEMNEEQDKVPDVPALIVPPTGSDPTMPVWEAVNSLGKWFVAPMEESPPASVADASNVWEFPLQFVALLTYPEQTTGKKSFALVRETALVKQRRRVLVFLTLFTLVVRYCSWDLFLVLLFASNCALLFLMKNSRKVNVTLAKRGIKQRVIWAKTWAGGLLRRGQTMPPEQAVTPAHQPRMLNGTPPPATASPNPTKRGLLSLSRFTMSTQPRDMGSISDTPGDALPSMELPIKRKSFFRAKTSGPTYQEPNRWRFIKGRQSTASSTTAIPPEPLVDVITASPLVQQRAIASNDDSNDEIKKRGRSHSFGAIAE